MNQEISKHQKALDIYYLKTRLKDWLDKDRTVKKNIDKLIIMYEMIFNRCEQSDRLKEVKELPIICPNCFSEKGRNHYTCKKCWIYARYYNWTMKFTTGMKCLICYKDIFKGVEGEVCSCDFKQLFKENWSNEKS